MTSLEWNEQICWEMTGTPDRPYAQLTKRAEEECEKRLQVYLAVRKPQEDLDPRIIKLVKDRAMSLDEKPYLHYGLIVHTDTFKPCVVRNRLKVAKHGTSENDETHEMLEVMHAVRRFLQKKSRLPISMESPFEDYSASLDHMVIALDNTDTLRHKTFKLWKKFIGPALQIIRDELGLGDQKAMWWWDCHCDMGWISPIPDYNPPQINQMCPKLRALSHVDSDSESEIESETE